jgi:hypothetical protein
MVTSRTRSGSGSNSNGNMVEKLADAKWLNKIASGGSPVLWITADKLGKGRKPLWAEFKALHAGKSHRELVIMQGLKPTDKVHAVEVIDNRTTQVQAFNSSVFIKSFEKMLDTRMVKHEKRMRLCVKNEVARQLETGISYS